MPEQDLYGMTKTGTIGDEITVRYFHIYYDNVRASKEKNECLKQLMKKEEHLPEKLVIKKEKLRLYFRTILIF